MRMTQKNWDRIETHNKKTTIRVHELKEGIQNVYCGSRYKPKLLGQLKVSKPSSIKMFKELIKKDAKSDGFNTLTELTLELMELNKNIMPDTILFIHPIKKVSKNMEVR